MPYFEDKPQKCEVPEEYNYAFMIYALAKMYGISPVKAGELSEYDFWLAVAFNNIEIENSKPDV